LAAYANRTLVTQEEDVDSAGSQVVGFADMVGFTTLTRRSTEDELVAVVDRFDSMTAEVVAENHGRIVKMIGDEVLFVADALEDSPGYTIRHRRPTSVRGYARLRPSVLRRGGAEVFVRDLPDGTEIPHLPLVPDDGRRR